MYFRCSREEEKQDKSLHFSLVLFIPYLMSVLDKDEKLSNCEGKASDREIEKVGRRKEEAGT